MQNFIGVKLIKAKPMNRLEYNVYRGWELPSDEDGADDGFLVEYVDSPNSNHPDHKGYISWSPKDVFEEAYRETDGLPFGLAIEAMKKGLKVARKNWNGKDMFVYYVEGSTVLIEDLRGACAEAVQFSSNTAPVQNICGHIDMKSANGDIVIGWLASQTDILSGDWFIVD